MKKNIKKYLVIFLAFFVLFTSLSVFGFNYYLNKDHEKKMEENKESNIVNLEEIEDNLTERVNILVMGVDYLHLGKQEGQRGTRTDTIMLFSIDPKTNRAFLLSIPRDSRVMIEGHGYDKINHAHSFGGTDLSIKTISNFLDIPIHHYVKVDYNAVIELVDAVGGVEIDIPQDMNYSLLNIHFKKGYQTLNGEDAVKYLRFRSGYANADIGRIGAQQEFVKLLMKKIISPSLIVNVPKYVEILNTNVETDMSKKEMLEIAKHFVKSSPDEMRREVIPGDGKNINGVSYWVVFEDAKKQLLDELLSDVQETTTDTNTETNSESGK